MSQRLPPLLALRAFEAAGRHLSFTLASHELHLTQGAISRQVRQLEDFLKQKLFVRLTRRVELTDAGRDYLEAVQQALGVVESATRRCLADEHRVLTIDILPTLGAYWLMPRLTRFSERHPDIEVRVVTSIEPANLQNKELDLAIRVGRLPGKRYGKSAPRIELEMASQWKGVEAYRLFDDVLVPVMSKELARTGHPVREPKDLLQFRLINNATRKSAWRDWFACHGVAAFDGSATLDYGHFFMTLQAAKEGRGVALIPKVIFDNLPASEGLYSPIVTNVNSSGEYYLLTKESTQNDPAIVAMREWLLEEAEELSTKEEEGSILLPSDLQPHYGQGSAQAWINSHASGRAQ